MQRVKYLDLAKGFIVFIMPSVHVVLLCSESAIQQSLLGDILKFLAEGPGAQLFMFIMGTSIKLSKTITTKKVLHRTIFLFLGGFGLNLFKFCIPMQLEILPAAFLQDFPLTETQFLVMGDIFHFAAIVYPVTYFISRLKFYPLWAFLISILIALISPYLWDRQAGISMVDAIWVYFTGGPPYVFFPVFPWLVYPLIGVAMADMLQEGKFAGIGFAVVIVSLGLPATTELTTHYRTWPADTLFHIGIVLLWLSLFKYLSNKIKPNFFFGVLTFCSRNITVIYLIQWVLICWLMCFTGYLRLPFWPTIIWMINATLATLILTYFLTKSKTPL